MKRQLCSYIILFLLLLVLPFLFFHGWQSAVKMEENADEVRKEAVVSASASSADGKSEKTGSAQEAEEASQDHQNVLYAPNVTAKMYQPEYWLLQCSDPDQLLMTEKEIHQLNKEIIGDINLAYNIFSEEFRREFLNTASRMETWENAGKEVVSWGNFGYAICVKRTEIKEFPQEQPLGEDPYFDENLLTTARTNTPMLVDGQTEDGIYYHVICYDYQGWALAENVALCAGLEQWEQLAASAGWAEFIADSADVDTQSVFLTVTVPRLRMEITGELLTMGTTMRLLTVEEAEKVLVPGSFLGCYVAELAGRTEEGMYEPRYEAIPVSSGVVKGYMNFTRERLVEQMFLFLGNAYGWGNSQESVDCSGLVQDVLSSFGIRMPRDAKEQQQVPLSRITFTPSMGKAEREEILNLLSPGDILYFPGHIMFYLGRADGEYYVLNAASSMKAPGASEEELLTVRRVIVNSLSMERRNGSSWMQELERAVCCCSRIS